jgi:hypothetical protein
MNLPVKDLLALAPAPARENAGFSGNLALLRAVRECAGTRDTPRPAGRIGVPIVLASPLSAADRSSSSAREFDGP